MDLKINWKNLKSNWYFVISSVAFLCLNSRATFAYGISILVSAFIVLKFSSTHSSFLNTINKYSVKLRIFSVWTAAGICIGLSEALYNRSLRSTDKIPFLNSYFGIDLTKVFYYCAPIAALGAFMFVYICVAWFWQKFLTVMKELAPFDDLAPWELATYLILFVIVCGAMAVIFAKTGAFYPYDRYGVIYTCDSPMYINSFVSTSKSGFVHTLFGIFTAPFMGLPALLAKILCAPPFLEAIIMNIVQIALLFLATFMLAKIMNLMPTKRVIFFIMNYCSYTYLLYTLTMEHYIIYLFWLSLLMLAIIRNSKFTTEIFMAAAGVISSSAVIIIFLSKYSPFRNFREWLNDITKIAAKFFVLLLAFGHFDTIFNLFTAIENASRFTGKYLPWLEKIRQYTFFIRNCFLAPAAGRNFTHGLFKRIFMGLDELLKPSWQLFSMKSVSYIGILILVLCIVSAVINWKKISSRLAFTWIVLSFLLLCVLGWGTSENGLILYSLYFYWAFFMLIYQLIASIEARIHIRFLIPLYFATNLYMFLMINLPAMKKLVDFAMRYYPIIN